MIDRSEFGRVLAAVLILIFLIATFLAQNIFLLFVAVLGTIYVLNLVQPSKDILGFDRLDAVFIGALILVALYFTAVAIIRFEPLDELLYRRPDGPEDWRVWLGSGVVGALAFLNWRNSKDLIQTLDRVLLPTFLICIALTLVAYFYGHILTDFDRSLCRTGFGIFNPNVFAFFLASFTGWASVFMVARNRIALAMIVLASGLFCLIMVTGGRTAIVAMSVSATLGVAIASKRKLRDVPVTLLTSAISSTCAFGLLELLNCSIIQRFETLSNAADLEKSFSSARRFDLWELALIELRGNYLFGLGFVPDAAMSHPEAHIHNQYLSWLVWGGVPGFALFMFFGLFLLYYCVQRAGLIGLALYTGSVGFMALNFLTDSILYFSNAYMQFVIVCVFIAALCRNIDNAAKMDERSQS